MKLLLTSGGLRNPTLARALLELAGKAAGELKVAFIPTAMHTEPGDKGWAIDQMLRLRDMGIPYIDIVEISAVSKDVWLPRLEACNVFFVNGGSTTHLMNRFNDSGLSREIPRLLKNRIYVGASAGSYVTTPDLRFNSDGVTEIQPGLGLVDFGLQVHMHSPKFPMVKTEAAVRKRVKDLAAPYIVYALDDEMAVKVDGADMQIVGEGKYLKLEPGIIG